MTRDTSKVFTCTRPDETYYPPLFGPSAATSSRSADEHHAPDVTPEPEPR